MHLIQTAHFVLLLLVEVVSLTNLNLVGCYGDFFLFTLLYDILLLILKEFDLGLGVQLIDFNTSYLVIEILVLHLLLLDVLSNLGCLLEEVHGRLLDCCVFTLTVHQLLHQFLRFGMQLHDVRLDQIHLLLDALLLNIGLLRLLLGGIQRFRQQCYLRVQFLQLFLQLIAFRLEVPLLIIQSRIGMVQLFRLNGFFLDLIIHAIQFSAELDVDLLLETEGLLDRLKSLIHALHGDETLLPTLKEVLLARDDLLHLQLRLLHDRTSLLRLLLL